MAAQAEAKAPCPQLKGWSGTVHTMGVTEELKVWFMENCKRWVFQIERGEVKGNLHYQCTFEMKVRKRAGTIAADIREALATPLREAKDVHVAIQPLSAIGGRAAWNYSKKVATRVEGPWGSSGAVDPPVPAEIKEIALRDWQETVVAIARRPWSREICRKITVILDVMGGSGKSTLMKYMTFHKHGHIIQPGEAKSMCREAQNVCDDTGSEPRTWIIDLPREKSRMLAKSDFWTGIECLKNGQYADDRHHHKSTMAEFNPNVIIFTNEVPDWSKQTEDRWEIGMVIRDKLEDWSPVAAKAMEEMRVRERVRKDIAAAAALAQVDWAAKIGAWEEERKGAGV